MAPPTQYEYDVFISYRRVSIIEQWLAKEEFFHDLLVSYLTMELMRPPRIFRDKLSLKAGDNFPREIERALVCSRCLLPIGTADYFSSAWCRAEFETFMDRSELTQGADIIVPVAWHDWDPPPEELGHLQITNFRPLAFIGIRGDQRKTVPFQETMGEFCAALARKIEKAPPFDPNWRVVMPNADDYLQPAIRPPRQAA